MISKVISGQSFTRLCEYLCKDQNRAIVIGSEGVRDYRYELMAKDFERQSCLNKAVKSPVLHIILSYYPGELIADKLLVNISKEYLALQGIKNTQFAIVKHTDRNHLHTHIIVNRIDNNGNTIKDGWIGYKGKKIAQALTLQYGLIKAKKKTPELTQLEQRNEYEVQRFLIYQKIHELLPRCSNIEELKIRLEEAHIQLLYKYKGSSKEIQGVSFQKGVFKYKGSEIDRQLSFLNLTKLLAQNTGFKQQQKHRSTLQSKRGSAARETSEIYQWKNKNLLEELLRPEELHDAVPYELIRRKRKLKC